jgi:hypothetical protein
MKTLGRILIILLAAAIVIGGTYALSQTPAFAALIGQPLGEGETGERPAPPDLADGQSALPGEVGERPTGGPEGSGGSWETMGRNLLQLAAIVVAVQVGWSIGRQIKRLVEKHQRLQVSHSS